MPVCTGQAEPGAELYFPRQCCKSQACELEIHCCCHFYCCCCWHVYVCLYMRACVQVLWVLLARKGWMDLMAQWGHQVRHVLWFAHQL